MKRASEILKIHGLKKTTIRIKVIEMLETMPHAVSQSEIEAQLFEEADRVTIYRTLNSLEDKGVVHKIIDREGLSRFALCSSNCTEHKHNDEHLHFQCTECSRLFCLSIPAAPILELPKGFTMSRLRLLADGVCRECG